MIQPHTILYQSILSDKENSDFKLYKKIWLPKVLLNIWKDERCILEKRKECRK